MTAKLPAHLIHPPDEYLTDLPVGEASYIDATDMLVDAHADCYLNPDAVLHDNGENRIRVRREKDGFHVIIPKPGILYKPKRKVHSELLFPVQSIQEDYPSPSRTPA
jgi:hypothetical protein